MSVSLVARQEGVSASLLFTWRRLEREGALVCWRRPEFEPVLEVVPK